MSTHGSLDFFHSVNRVVQSSTPKRVEVEVLKDDGTSDEPKDEAAQRRMRIAKRAAKELKEGVSFTFSARASPFAS